MLHEALDREPGAALGIAPVVNDDDRGISAQARSMPDLDRVLAVLARHHAKRDGAIVDLGCGMGGLTNYIADRLGLDEMIGVDLDAERLKVAGARGVRPLLLDLTEDPLPLADGSVQLVSCFGLLAYLPLYDNVLSEASRVLDDDGWLLLSMPNLASYSNRISLLFGYQPHAVAVSRHREAGKIRGRRDGRASTNMPPLLHAATLRCMRELLARYGFDTVTVRGFAAGPRRRPVVDTVLSRLPSLSRRFLILARKRPTV
ncbi:MAG: class I SAM-dependent methyltransferase [Actinobacteria bacterium]|nr:class I SAM-dependent methyltransferase [Actinomycetota bacterium]